MAKEPKGARALEDKVPQPPESVGGSGGMNTGVAVVGFVLCFLAGAGIMYGWDQHQKKSDISADNDKGGETDTKDGAKIGGRKRGAEGAAFDGAGAWSDDQSPVPVTSKDPMWGRRDAPVTIVVFSDFQCPFCSKVEPQLKQVRETYGPEKVRMLWKNYPLSFHPNAKPAAEAAQGVYELAGNEAFWKFHDTAFSKQGELNQDSYEKWAKESGVKDMKAFTEGLTSHKWAAKVDADTADGNKSGVRGTPASFINGIFLSGAQPYDKFQAVIDAELKKAQAKIAAGTPKDRVYVAVSQENKKAAPEGAKGDDDGAPKEDTKTVFKVPVGTSPVLGNPNALVTAIVFSDFQCPFCSKVEPTLKALRDKYGDKLRFVWKNEPLPFHNRAEPAAEVAMEARAQQRDAGFWKAHDKLFEIQGTGLKDDDLFKAAADLGLNVDKVKNAVANHVYKKDIDADADLAEDFGASGTPNFFINGRHLVGAQPQNAFEAIIDEEIKKAGELAKTVKPGELYDTLIKDGKGPPDAEKKTVALNPKSPFRGNANAKVVIQEFSDFECPFCQKAEDSVKEVLKNYGDRVKFVWRDMPLPFHKSAPGAAEAAREAFKQKGNAGFWEMHDKMFTNPPAPPAQPGQQPQQPQRDLSRAQLDKYAAEMHLDMAAWAKAMDSEAYKADIEADTKAGNDAGINGTPAFIINGYFISGAQPFPKFRKLIERALSEAK